MSKLSSLEKLEFWRLAVAEQELSGLTARAFCKRQGLSVPSFYAWRRKARLASAAADSEPLDPGAENAGLVPVKLIPQPRRDAVAAQREHRPTSHWMQSGCLGGSTPAASGGRSLDAMEIATPGGFTLRVSQAIEVGWLSTILTTLVAVERGVSRC